MLFVLFLGYLSILLQVNGQSFEDCYPSYNETLANSTIEIEVDDIELDVETVDIYMELCLPRMISENSTKRELLRRTSEICEFSIDSGQPCDQGQNFRWKNFGYDSQSGVCRKFRYNGCGGNENRFSTRIECSYICEDPCKLRVRPGRSTFRLNNCSENAGMFYYYDQTEGQCNSFYYQGCAGNKNRFETSEECMSVCSEKDTSEGLSSMMEFAPSFSSEENMTDPQSYCSQFTETFPEETQIISALEMTTSAEYGGQLLDELHSRISGAPNNDSSNQTSFRPLKHITVRKYNHSDCRKIHITIRIWCIPELSSNISLAEERRLCDLVKSGIKKHWEVDILGPNGTVDYPVTIIVIESFFLSKKVILKSYSSPSQVPQSYNPGWTWFPMVVNYHAYDPAPFRDIRFQYVAANEFGHDILMAQGGLVWSWGHEGTSNIFGITLPSAPSIPPSPAPIDVMQHFNSGFSLADYNRLFASQSQINALVEFTMWQWHFEWCPGDIGAPCLHDIHCILEGILRWLRREHCDRDNDCAPNKYCKGLFNPFIRNRCVPKKPNGELCFRDAMCRSGMCNWFRCVECEEDHHCPQNEFCKNKNLPGILNECIPKKKIGQHCLEDRVCQSGFCDNLRCVECEEHWDCGLNQFCAWKDQLFVVNRCKNKKCRGFCTLDVQCLSGKCHWWKLCKPCWF